MVQRSLEEIDHNALLKRMIIDVIRKHNYTKVSKVVDILQNLDKTVTINEIHGAINELRDENQVTVSEPQTQVPFLIYLKSLGSFAFWSTTFVTSLVLVTIYLIPDVMPWSIVRIVVGGAFALFLPGYTLMQLVFPSKDLDVTEFVVLSVGLSFCMLPLIGLVSSYSPWGMTLPSIVTSLGALCVALSLVGSYRRLLLARTAIPKPVQHHLVHESDCHLQ